MANPEHLKILEQGVEVWNKWRDDNRGIEPDLTSANISRGDSILDHKPFKRVNFSFTNLNEAYLGYTNLYKANFNKANLYRTNLNNSTLINANFSSAQLCEADLSATNLTETIFISCNLEKLDIRGAKLGYSKFINCNLNGIKNLATCKHFRWSTIDHLTLAQSMNLPLSFLRGCGLPEEIIDLIPVLQNDPIIFYSCFISYSSKDEEFANRLYADLQDKGIRCWYAPEKMKGGKKIYDQVNEAIRMHDKLLLVLSEDSMKSDWVATEIKKARAREKKEKRQMLFPIGIVPYDYIKQWELFDADTGVDLAAEVRSYHIPDFSEWKRHDSYKKGFERVVKDLKGEKKIVL